MTAAPSATVCRCRATRGLRSPRHVLGSKVLTVAGYRFGAITGVAILHLFLAFGLPVLLSTPPTAPVSVRPG